MGAPLRGDKLFRFLAPGGATFNFKKAIKILYCPYLKDLILFGTATPQGIGNEMLQSEQQQCHLYRSCHIYYK